MADSIYMTKATVDALETIGLGDFSEYEMPERMAWVVLVLKKLEDREKWFPRGKWATIQHIERQLDEQAQATVDAIELE